MSSLLNLEKSTVHTSFICSLVLGKRIAFEGFMFPSATSISKGCVCDWCRDDRVLGPRWFDVTHRQPETWGFARGQWQESAFNVPQITLPGWGSLCLLTARWSVPSSGTFLLLLCSQQEKWDREASKLVFWRICSAFRCECGCCWREGKSLRREVWFCPDQLCPGLWSIEEQVLREK